jgi:hypothetical protein
MQQKMEKELLEQISELEETLRLKQEDMDVMVEERQTVHQVNLELMDSHESLLAKYEQLK